MVGRHQHDDPGSRGLGAPRALDRQPGAEVAAGHDHRHAPGHMREAEVEQRLPLAVRERKLLRVVRQDAQAVHALIDHAVEHAALAVQIEVAGLGERRGRDRKDSGEGISHSRRGHSLLLSLRQRSKGIPSPAGQTSICRALSETPARSPR
jgi:hypothetical protein